MNIIARAIVPTEGLEDIELQALAHARWLIPYEELLCPVVNLYDQSGTETDDVNSAVVCVCFLKPGHWGILECDVDDFLTEQDCRDIEIALARYELVRTNGGDTEKQKRALRNIGVHMTGRRS